MNPLVDFLQKIPVPILLLLSALSVTLGDFFAKYWSGNTRNIFFMLAIAGYLGSGVLYIPTLLKHGLVVTALTWSILSNFGFILVGIVIFKERFTMLQGLGVVLGIISICILILAE